MREIGKTFNKIAKIYQSLPSFHMIIAYHANFGYDEYKRIKPQNSTR